MEEEGNTYVEAVSAPWDDKMVNTAIKVFKELNLEEGESVEFSMEQLVELIDQETAQDVQDEENERELDQDRKQDDYVISADIEGLVSSIQNRQYQEEINKVNNLQEGEEMEPHSRPLNELDLNTLGLNPNPDCRPKGGAAAAVEVPLLNDEELDQYVQDQRSANTVKRTKQVVGKFQQFKETQYLDHRPMWNLDPATMNNYVCNFLLTTKRLDGSSYEPDTLTSILRALDRHLKEKKYPFSLLIDSEFEGCRSILASRRKELKADGKGGRPNRSEAITPEQIEVIWEKGLFGEKDAKTLQNTIYYYLTCGFGFRGCHESRQLKWGDVSPGIDEDGQRYLELKCERLTKTRQGAEGGHNRAYNPRVYEDRDATRCPLLKYELFALKRPTDMMLPTSPFYLSPKPHSQAEDDTWYKTCPMGINMLSKVMPGIAEAAGFTGKITNHSLRRTTCQNLVAANLPSTSTIQLTGHKSVDSLNNYATATKRQQKEMALIATGQKKTCLEGSIASLESYKENDGKVSPPAPNAMANVAGPASLPGVGGFVAAASGMFAGASISGPVTVNINFQASSGNVSAHNVDLDVQNNQN